MCFPDRKQRSGIRGRAPRVENPSVQNGEPGCFRACISPRDQIQLPTPHAGFNKLTRRSGTRTEPGESRTVRTPFIVTAVRYIDIKFPDLSGMWLAYESVT